MPFFRRNRSYEQLSAALQKKREKEEKREKAEWQKHLAKLRTKGDVDALIKTLREGDVYERRAAAEVLGQLGDPRAVEPLVQALHNRETWGWAVKALGALGDERAVPALGSELESANWTERGSVEAALKRIGGPEAEAALAGSGKAGAAAGGLPAGGVLAAFAEPLASMAKMPEPEQVAPGSFWIKVVGTYHDASTAVGLGATLAAAAPGYEVLAVMAVKESDGTLALEGKDSSGKSRELRTVDRPAVLFVPRDTLPNLKSDRSLWARVQQVEEAHP